MVGTYFGKKYVPINWPGYRGAKIAIYFSLVTD
jgi:hypothetical protein